MRLSPAAGEIDLLLSFREPSLLFIGGAIVATGAAHAFHKQIRFTVGVPDGMPTRAAEGVLADLQPVADGDPFIKHKALAAPQALVLGNPFEVLEDATFKVIDLLHPGLLKERRRFLATNATGAEHGDPRLSGRVNLRFKPIRQFAE
jgi:hypothetical protein